MPKLSKKIADPVFGDLFFDVLWSGWAIIEPYGKIEILVEGAIDRPPTDRQREAFEEFVSLFPEFKTAIEEEILEYYIKNREGYLDNSTDPEVEVPDISTIADMEKLLLSGPLMFVGEETGDAISIKMRWSTTFDDEHGIEIELENNEIVGIGPS